MTTAATSTSRDFAPDNENDSSIEATVDVTVDDDAEKKPQPGNDDGADDEITEDSDLSNLSRRIWIVTTAGLPWMTGTAVNPLLRALSLAEHRPKDYVTLMIPWLPSAEARTALYGAKHVFESPKDQEAWIRKYCMERCNCTEETASKLRIQFWKGVYQESFGSIFPLDDICSTIPRAEADICILEEPEHLNWFRVPAKPNPTQTEEQVSRNAPIGPAGADQPFEHAVVDTDIEVLGWSNKFRHVVGILHTNYSDYIRQYGMASLVTAPALNALSSLVVKAYCHKVIRLSATLPHLDANREVTCNVHGVRHEFLERPASSMGKVDAAEMDVTAVEKEEKTDDPSGGTHSAVYFIGKLIWAKGFENVLELEERFKEATGDYFPMDIYGGGKDEKEIKVAFFGRNNTTLSNSSTSLDAASAAPEADQKVAAVFGSSNSLRDQLISSDGPLVDDDYVLLTNTASLEGDVSLAVATASTTADGTTQSENPEKVENTAKSQSDQAPVDASTGAPLPLDVLGDLSGKTLSTTVDTADATMKLIESVMKAGLNAIAGGKEGSKGKDGGEASISPKMSLPFHIAPAKTRFKWRRNAVPARFLGVQDHIIVRDIAEQKVFLNMSTSEVLCTTSAECLAMGKWAILPKHPSNTFFLQFPNCLSYETMDECVSKLQYALENEPEPLSDEHVRALSWEGATDRLVKASAMSKREAAHRVQKGLNKSDIKAAQFHVDAGKKSDWLRAKILK